MKSKNTYNDFFEVIKINMENYKNITVNIEKVTLRQIKQLALDTETTQKEIINRYLKEGLKRDKKD